MLDVHVDIASLNINVSLLLDIHVDASLNLHVSLNIHICSLMASTRNVHVDSTLVALVRLGNTALNTARLLDFIELDSAVVLLHIHICVVITTNVSLIICADITIHADI